MANCKVTILVERTTVVSNGDPAGSPPNHAGGLKNNAISATLDYPRGGRPEIASAIQADLQDNQPYVFNISNFYGPQGDGVHAPGLFKEELIEEECPLMIQITSNDDAGHLTQVLEKVFDNLLGASVFVVPGGQIVSAALEFAAGSLGDIIAGQSKGSIQVIGAAHVMLNAAQLLAAPNPLRMTLPLIARRPSTKKGWQSRTNRPPAPKFCSPIRIYCRPASPTTPSRSPSRHGPPDWPQTFAREQPPGQWRK